MQVNSANLAALGMSIEDAFDECKSIRAGATILRGDYERALKQFPDEQTALRAAISAYNTGDFARGRWNGYLAKVQYARRAIPDLIVAERSPNEGVAPTAVSQPRQEAPAVVNVFVRPKAGRELVSKP
jgi:soluble lytic murein transglycosylase-like protein